MGNNEKELLKVGDSVLYTSMTVGMSASTECVCCVDKIIDEKNRKYHISEYVGYNMHIQQNAGRDFIVEDKDDIDTETKGVFVEIIAKVPQDYVVKKLRTPWKDILKYTKFAKLKKNI